MRRRILLVVGVCMLVALAASPWTVSPDTVARHAGVQIASLTGLDLSVSGRATISLLPLPRIKLDGVTLARPGEPPSVVADHLRGDIRIFPLIGGRIELSELRLVRARADLIDRSQAPILESWLGLKPGSDAAAEAGLGINRLVMIQSDVRYRDTNGRDLRFTDVNAVITPPSPASGLDLSATLKWHEEPIEIAYEGPARAHLDAGKPAGIELSLSSALGRIVLAGAVNGQTNPQFDGRVTASARDLSRLAARFGLWHPIVAGIGTFAFDSPVSATARRLTLSKTSMSIGDDALEGALTVQLGGERPLISGTLAGSSLDLTRFLPADAFRAQDGRWSTDNFDLSSLSLADLDLRLSAATAQIGRVTLEQAALGVLVKAGRMDMTLGRAGVDKGGVKGRLTLASTATGMEVKAQAAFDRLDLSSLTLDLTGERRASGEFNGQFSLESAGANMRETMAALTGKAGFTAQHGEIIGLNFADALRAADKRPLSATAEWRGGRSPFETISMHLDITRGVAQLSEGAIASKVVKGSLSGQIDIVSRLFDLKGVLAPAGATGPLSATLPVDIRGSWSAPVISPNVKALIERSGAAVPLIGRSIAGAPPVGQP